MKSNELLKSVFGEPDPNYEKWKRGRPTKAQLARRKLYNESIALNNKPGFIKSLLDSIPLKVETQSGELKIAYRKRSNGNN